MLSLLLLLLLASNWKQLCGSFYFSSKKRFCYCFLFFAFCFAIRFFLLLIAGQSSPGRCFSSTTLPPSNNCRLPFEQIGGGWLYVFWLFFFRPRRAVLCCSLKCENLRFQHRKDCKKEIALALFTWYLLVLFFVFFFSSFIPLVSALLQFWAFLIFVFLFRQLAKSVGGIFSNCIGRLKRSNQLNVQF